MIEVKQTMELVDGSKISLPMTQEEANQIFAITLTVNSVNMGGDKIASVMPPQGYKTLHATAEQLNIAGLGRPEQRKELESSLEDSIVDFLIDLGVKFED